MEPVSAVPAKNALAPRMPNVSEMWNTAAGWRPSTKNSGGMTEEPCSPSFGQFDVAVGVADLRQVADEVVECRHFLVAAEEQPGAVAEFDLLVDPGVFEGQGGGGDGELVAAADHAQRAARQVPVGVEVLDLGADPGTQRGRVVTGDRADPDASLGHALPGGRGSFTECGQQSDAGHHDPAVGGAHAVSSVRVSARTVATTRSSTRASARQWGCPSLPAASTVMVTWSPGPMKCRKRTARTD